MILRDMVKKVLFILLFIIAFTTNLCYPDDDEYNDPNFYGDTFDWINSSPIEFLELLKSKKNEDCPTYTVFEIHDNWVKFEYTHDLIELLDSKEPCANVHSIYSSLRDCNKSTIGREAAFIIEGFRKGKYPPGLNSGRATVIVSEIKEWWNNLSQKKAAEPSNTVDSQGGPALAD